MEQSQGSIPRQAIAAAERNRASEEQALTAEFLDQQRQLLNSLDGQIAELEELREVAIGAHNEALFALGLRRRAVYASLDAVGDFDAQPQVPKGEGWAAGPDTGAQSSRTYGTGRPG